MKVALVHDALIEFGGAERFLQGLLEAFPEAHVYTAFADKKIVREFFSSIPRLRFDTSWAQGTPLMHHSSLFQCVSPLIWSTFNLEQYDLVISSSAYMFSNLLRVRRPAYVQYIHSLPKNIFGLEPKTPLQGTFPYAGFLRRLYIRALRSTQYILTNSKHTHDTLLRICGIESTVMYPPVSIPSRVPKKQKGKYFLCVSRIDKTKGLELPIIACSKLGLPLKLVGVASDMSYERYLRSLAGPTVEFLGFLPDSEIHKLYESARAFIFPSHNEDFGIAPVEAMGHGVPIIAYRGGGALETVRDRVTGLFFNKYTVASLIKALKIFHTDDYTIGHLYKHARAFSQQVFTLAIRDYVRCIEKLEDSV